MERSSIFDMIGPVMIGPSSSHTAGVARIGRLARHVLGMQPAHVRVTWYNSFATTFQGHGSDRALMAGLLDMPPDDDRLREALALAQQAGLRYEFQGVLSAPKHHPNTVRLEMTGPAGEQASLTGVSRGGGLITGEEIDGFHTQITGQLPTLIIKADDVKGSIAFITSVLANDDSNIATMTVGRVARNNLACLVMEMDSPPRPLSLEYLAALHWVRQVRMVPTVA